MAGIFDKQESPAIIIGGYVEHVHALFLLSKKLALCKLVEAVKTGSSKWLKLQDISLRDFSWQNGYGAFSGSESSVIRVQRYIEDQEQHHRIVCYQDEFRAFLRRHGLQCDERYVWD